MTWQAVAYFLLWAGFFALMMRFGCGAHVMGHGHRHGSAPGSGQSSNSGTPLEEVADPVCGMKILAGTAKSAFYQGRPYYFCSTACRDKFESSPARYASTQASTSTQKESHHGCC